MSLNVNKSLLEGQANAFKASFLVLFDELKEEIKTCKEGHC